MITVSVLGTGKVGTHFIKAFINHKDIKLLQIYSRSAHSLHHYKGIKGTTQSTLELLKADIYIVALPDDVIPTLDLTHLKGLVVHTSGTVSYHAIKAKNRGVLYPAQSFTKEKEIELSKVPFCLETEFKKDDLLLENFTKLFSDRYQYLDEQKRQKLHLAAVFANNFSNRMIGIAHDICQKQAIDFELLQPLIQETFLKTQIIAPNLAQTGPAIREDQHTINKHLSLLSGLNKDIYEILTKSIQNQKHAEL